METRFCLFCARRNPGDAKFCNECGTALDLKPCRQCDAVNARIASRCHRCDAAMPVDEAQDASVDVAEPVAAQTQPVGEVVATGEATAITLAADALTRAWRSSGPVAAAESAVALAPPPMVRAMRTDVDQSTPVARAPALDHPLAGERVDEPAPDATPPEPLPVGADETQSVEWRVDAARLPDEAASTVAPPVYRPPRARAAVVVLLLLMAFGVPATIYLLRHPEALSQLSLVRDRTGASEAIALPQATSAQPASESSAPTPASTGDSAAPNDEMPPPTAAPTTPAEVAPPASDASAPSSGAPSPASTVPEARDSVRDGRSASPTTRRTTRSRNESRNEARTPLPTQRETPPSPPVSPQVQCTPAVAALGLCNP